MSSIHGVERVSFAEPLHLEPGWHVVKIEGTTATAEPVANGEEAWRRVERHHAERRGAIPVLSSGSTLVGYFRQAPC